MFRVALIQNGSQLRKRESAETLDDVRKFMLREWDEEYSGLAWEYSGEALRAKGRPAVEEALVALESKGYVLLGIGIAEVEAWAE
ncbi:hypothetical protein [Streptomyces sp. NPDC046939]|uniref:hypothetical protein n=1 Tax=Streptomyces sp. NPDC046939 TaxID=3155376 RepID=UPI0033CF4D86